ncbi:hypothetical protein GCM10009570_07640 [Dietzia natronolimnaea]
MDTVTTRPVNWRLGTQFPVSDPVMDDGAPISITVVRRKPSDITSPRTSPTAIRSPTAKTLPRRCVR